MFVPFKTTERFDRTIFNGTGVTVNLKPVSGVTWLRYFYWTDKIVGQITGKVQAVIYPEFKREGWIPVEIIHNEISYCGWIDEKLIEIKTPLAQ